MTAITDDLPAQLIHSEHEGWQAMTRGEGGTHSFNAMLPDAIMVFPGSLIERGAVIVALDGVVWSEYTMSDQRVVRLGDRAAMLVYRLRGVRERQPVDLWASTTYVYHEGRWRVGAHQQTPAGD
ncbi:MAG: DUF4440 domain-containing protein [Microcella sp.]|uniref:DUF4440 domain-containing protein n=1 Tax=Microcella sp. TaxID=1913979 RepID=UPI0024CB699F|nr:DUF4440 domain-containing protein [Microcella sp.]UYN82958.1 MAG: DUF4440 domain-containing protein [Microcella sp.]